MCFQNFCTWFCNFYTLTVGVAFAGNSKSRLFPATFSNHFRSSEYNYRSWPIGAHRVYCGHIAAGHQTVMTVQYLTTATGAAPGHHTVLVHFGLSLTLFQLPLSNYRKDWQTEDTWIDGRLQVIVIRVVGTGKSFLFLTFFDYYIICHM